MEYCINILKTLLLLFLFTNSVKAKEFSIFELTDIAQKIYTNECSSKLDYLVYWNDNENFASVGIGHFIWYPMGVEKKFDESFPKLLKFMKNQGVIIPKWLKNIEANPWTSKQEMLQDPRSKKLREFLQQTISMQALFLARRLNNALPKILDSVDSCRHQKIQDMFNLVANEAGGYYLLLDYINFKGEGIKKSERYNGQGWGLLQVLECMEETINPKLDFANCAKKVLNIRIQNSPKLKHEDKWINGWFNRINTYTEKNI